MWMTDRSTYTSRYSPPGRPLDRAARNTRSYKRGPLRSIHLSGSLNPCRGELCEGFMVSTRAVQRYRGVSLLYSQHRASLSPFTAPLCLRRGSEASQASRPRHKLPLLATEGTMQSGQRTDMGMTQPGLLGLWWRGKTHQTRPVGGGWLG